MQTQNDSYKQEFFAQLAQYLNCHVDDLYSYKNEHAVKFKKAAYHVVQNCLNIECRMYIQTFFQTDCTVISIFDECRRTELAELWEDAQIQLNNEDN